MSSNDKGTATLRHTKEVMWQAFEHLRRAQEVLISHVSPQHDRDQEEAAPNSVSAGDPGRGQYVLLQVKQSSLT